MNKLTVRKITYISIIYTATSLLIHFFVTLPTFDLIFKESGRTVISDFLYHLINIKYFLLGKIDSFYIQDCQRFALSNFLNNPEVEVLQIGVTPTAILIWLPFILLSFLSNTIANTIWISTSTLVLGIAISKSLLFEDHSSKRNLILYISFIIIVFTSHIFVFSIFLGQTSILMCGIFLSLLLHLNSCKKREIKHSSIYILVVLFISSIKLPYFIACVFILLTYSIYKESILSTISILIYAFFTDIVFDYNLFMDWSKQLSTYLAKGSQGYLFLPTFVTLRSVMSGFIDDSTSLFISKILTSTAYFVLFAVGIFKFLKFKYAPIWTQNSLLIVLMFFTNSMLLPYSGSYEDVIIIVPLYMSLINNTDFNLYKICFAITMTLPFVYFNSKFLPYEFSALSLWLMKLTIFTSTILFNNAGNQNYDFAQRRALLGPD